jgi:hypothetical protein
MSLRKPEHQLSPIGGEMRSCFLEHGGRRCSAIAIDDDAFHPLGNGDERETFDPAKGPGRCSKPSDGRKRIFDPFRKSEFITHGRETNGRIAQETKRDLGFGQRLSKDVSKVEACPLDGHHTQIVLDRGDHRREGAAPGTGPDDGVRIVAQATRIRRRKATRGQIVCRGRARNGLARFPEPERESPVIRPGLLARHGERLRIMKLAATQCRQHIARVATSKAVEQDCSFAEADRKARTMIVMRRATAFPAATAPRSA